MNPLALNVLVWERRLALERRGEAAARRRRVDARPGPATPEPLLPRGSRSAPSAPLAWGLGGACGDER